MGARLVDIVIDRGNGQPPQKISLKPGHNLLLSGRAEGDREFFQVLTQALYPVSGRAAPLDPAAIPAITRFGLTLDQAGEVFRYALDCRAQGISLGRRKSGEENFAALSQAADFIERVTRHTLRFPTLEIYRELYAFPLGFPALGPAPQAVEADGYFADLPGEKPVQDERERLKELLAIQRRHDDLVRLERSQIEKQGELFKLEEKKTKLSRLEAALNQARQAYAEYDIFDELKGLPGDYGTAVKEYEVLQARREEELRHLDQRAEKLSAQALAETPVPLSRQPVFIGGFLALLAALVMASFYAAVRLYLLPVGLIGLGLVAYQGIIYLMKRDKSATVRGALNTLEQEKRDLLKKHASEKPVLQVLMEKFDLRDAQEILSVVRERQQALAQVQEEGAALKEAQGEIDLAQIEKDSARLTHELASLEKRMADLGLQSSGQDPAMIQKEIEELQARLGTADPSITGVGASRLAGKGPLERLTLGAALLLGMKAEELAARLKPALDANLQWLSGRKLGGSVWHQGIPQAVDCGGSPRSLQDLDAAAQGLLYFALRFTLLQGLGQKLPLPVVVLADERGENRLPPPAITRALVHLAKFVQVIHPTADPRFRDGAGHVAQLG